jgi:hypothetical protein
VPCMPWHGHIESSVGWGVLRQVFPSALPPHALKAPQPGLSAHVLAALLQAHAEMPVDQDVLREVFSVLQPLYVRGYPLR